MCWRGSFMDGPQGPAALGFTAGQCPQTQTPVLATVVAGSIVLAAALLVPFEGLLVTTNALTLGVFVLVDLALWRIQRKAPGTRSTFVAPRWVPLLGALVALTLMLGEFLL
jgi:basic amino acid/polyamine antiporter, APA family